MQQLQLILAAIKCHVQSLASDLAFATSTNFGHAQSLASDLAFATSTNFGSSSSCCSSSPAHECMAAKLESDAAGLMRLSLQMYNLIEARPRGGENQCLLGSSLQVTAEEVVPVAVVVHDFLRDSIDVAILSPEALAFCGATIHPLREQTQLLLNTLNAMVQELSSASACMTVGAAAAAAAVSDGRKRSRQP